MVRKSLKTSLYQFRVKSSMYDWSLMDERYTKTRSEVDALKENGSLRELDIVGSLRYRDRHRHRDRVEEIFEVLKASACGFQQAFVTVSKIRKIEISKKSTFLTIGRSILNISMQRK